jgi:hypothetical protein
MYPTAPTSLSSPHWEDLPLANHPNAQQLEQIETYLETILIALVSLGKIDASTLLNTAQNLKLEAIVTDWITLWQLPQSNPLGTLNQSRAKINLESLRAMVLIISQIAQQNQELIRRAVSLLEQRTAQNKPPQQTALLGDYLDSFHRLYQPLWANETAISAAELSPLAFKLLIDLLFYCGANGHRRLWLALLDYAR